MVPSIYESASASFRAYSLMYHDVVGGGDWSASGLAGADADLYKIDAAEFERHLDAISQALGARGTPRADAPAKWGSDRPVFLTFDDGGVSAQSEIAPALERRGWRGHFFVPTDYIGRPGFLTAAQIRDLHERGHVIGSHSCSHPRRISHCPRDVIFREWRESTRVLAEITGVPIAVASVPGGFHSVRVAQAAAQAGIRVLFNSEPASKPRFEGGCLVLGRYYIQRGTPPETAAAFVSGSAYPRFRQALLWKAKKAAKAAGGDAWFRFRQRVIERSSPATQDEAENSAVRRSRAA